MIQLRAGSGPWLGSAILRHGSEFTREVTLVQEGLMAAGYELPLWGADGGYGDETANAVMAFQDDHGLLMDGVVEQKSRGVLNALLNTDRYTTPGGHTGRGIPLGTTGTGVRGGLPRTPVFGVRILPLAYAYDKGVHGFTRSDGRNRPLRLGGEKSQVRWGFTF